MVAQRMCADGDPRAVLQHEWRGDALAVDERAVGRVEVASARCCRPAAPAGSAGAIRCCLPGSRRPARCVRRSAATGSAAHAAAAHSPHGPATDALMHPTCGRGIIDARKLIVRSVKSSSASATAIPSRQAHRRHSGRLRWSRQAAVIASRAKQSPAQSSPRRRLPRRCAPYEKRGSLWSHSHVLAGLVPAIVVAQCRYRWPGQARP